jgi:hypothetical protein
MPGGGNPDFSFMRSISHYWHSNCTAGRILEPKLDLACPRSWMFEIHILLVVFK